ncbi:MAG: hypothetical protein M1814_001400 [Vezdaea aestivalis]|nr:MAG: hypothetical protein M1814_001400 [Vezdaea aestivalis]
MQKTAAKLPGPLKTVIGRLSSISPFSSLNSSAATSVTTLPTPSSRSASFKTAAEHELFPKVDPSVDGPDCNKECASCTVSLPRKWNIEENNKLYGFISAWGTHVLVGTGKADWIRNVDEEEGGLVQALSKEHEKIEGEAMMLSASNIPLPDAHEEDSPDQPFTAMLFPSFLETTLRPSEAPSLIPLLNSGPKSTTSLDAPLPTAVPNIPTFSPPQTRPIPHSAVILLCSHGTRDKRCGQSAPLLAKEFNRHLRDLGMSREMYDDRPGGVGIYYISHVGGHKYAANVIIYRRRGIEGGSGSGSAEEGAAQGIWLGRVRPEDCEGIVKYTILKGKVIKPETQLRGGWNRERELVSW